MTKDEALKLALEALERMKQHSYLRLDYAEQAITAIKEALQIASIIACRDALDAQPVPRRWVGLTDDDLLQIRETVQVVEGRSLLQSLTKAIEQALKEKNT